MFNSYKYYLYLISILFFTPVMAKISSEWVWPTFKISKSTNTSIKLTRE